MGQGRTRGRFVKDQKDSQVTDKYRYWHFLGPKFWSTWLAIAGLYVLAWLPWRAKILAAKGLASVVKRVAKSRYRTLQTNIRLCFAHLESEQQNRLIEEALFSNLLGFIETAHAWCRGLSGINVEVEGQEHLNAALKDGRGIIYLTGHWSFLDLGAAIIGTHLSAGTIYRKHDNPLFNYFMTRSRERHLAYTVARKDVKGMIRRLQQGEGLAYMPDQDFGRKRSIFVPFFGVPTATITMTSKLAEAGNAIVLPISGYRKGLSSTYVFRIDPPMAIPSGDEQADAKLWTQWLESCIAQHPDQYLWLHKRFKTRPPGEPSVYASKR